MQSQPEAFLTALHAALAAAAPPLPSPPRWAAATAAAHADFDEYCRPVPIVGSLQLPEIVALLDSELLGPDALVTNGAGNYAGFLHASPARPPFSQRAASWRAAAADVQRVFAQWHRRARIKCMWRWRCTAVHACAAILPVQEFPDPAGADVRLDGLRPAGLGGGEAAAPGP